MGVNGIYGLSGSGMDIDSMVKVGMMSKQNEYDKMAQKFTKNEWTKAAYLTLNSSITTFNMSTLSQYKMSANMNAKTAESNSSAVKVTANGSAPIMSHRVEISELASNAYVISTNKPTRYGNDVSQSSIDLKNILFQNLQAVTNTDNVSGTTIDGGTFTANKNDTAMEFVLKDGATKNSDGSDKTATISFTYQEVLDGVTMTDLVSKINNSGLNIRASYDVLNDSFSMYNNESGADNQISIDIVAQDISTTTTNVTTINQTTTSTSTNKVYTSATGNTTAAFLNSWSLYQSKDGELYSPGTETLKDGTNAWKFTAAETNTYTVETRTIATGYHTGDRTTTSNGTNTIDKSTNVLAGSNAQIKVDGVEYTPAENKITINGLTYNALEKTLDPNGGVDVSGNPRTAPVTVSVSQDVDAIVDLYEKYDEKPESGYSPLTQSQKDSMKEEQITKWEEKAQKGLLYHDQTLGKIINEMRSAVTDTVDGIDGKYNSIYSIGISTTGIKGQLVLNEDKLRAALAEDSDAVYNVFAKLDSATDDSSKNGIAQRLGDVLSTASKNIKSRAGSTTSITEDSDLNNLLRQLQTKMSNFKKLMSSFEDKLYKKYDKMESALAKLGAQMNFIMGGSQ